MCVDWVDNHLEQVTRWAHSQNRGGVCEPGMVHTRLPNTWEVVAEVFPAFQGRLSYRLTPSLQSKNGRCGEIESLSSHRLWEHLPGRGAAVPEAPAEGPAGFGAQ